MITLIVAVTFLLLLLASYHDLRTSEIPDSISFLLSSIMIVFAVYAFITLGAPEIHNVFIIGGGYFLFSYLLYRLGQWGGGDVKIMAGVGLSLALLHSLGLAWTNMRIVPYWMAFYFNMGLVSIPYLIAYSLYATIKNPRIISQFKEKLSEKKHYLAFILLLIPALASKLMDYGFITTLFLLPPVYLLFSVYLKAVEGEALQKTIKVSELKEGDVVANDLIVDGIKIEGRHSIEGMSQSKINEIKKMASVGKIPAEIRIKWGVKFIPIITLAYIITLVAGNTIEIAFNTLLH